MILKIDIQQTELSFLTFDALGKSDSFKIYNKGINKIKKFIDSLQKNDLATYLISDYLLIENNQHYCSFIINLSINSMKAKQIQKIKDLIQEHIFDTIAYRNKIYKIKIIQNFENNILSIGIVFI